MTVRVLKPLIFGFLVVAAGAAAKPAATPTLKQALGAQLRQYLASRGSIEHISAVSLSVSLRGKPTTIDVTAGRTMYRGGSSVTPENLFQIGSNTKSFTSAEVLQLEAEHKLTLDQTVGHWLPQYRQWKDVTIYRLLDMTSGIPTYDNMQPMERDYARTPRAYFSPQRLIAYVGPHAARKKGWYYSNTGYLLTQLIIERAARNSYANEIRKRFIDGLGLRETYYEPHLYPSEVQRRMVAGYFDSDDKDNAGLAPLLRKDVRRYSVSWAQAAGAIVSTPRDLIRWVRALFGGPMLPPQQRDELLTIVSQKTGLPITATSSKEPRGFGLGVGEATQQPIGTFWFYEGETLGYRMAFAYIPRADAVIVVGVNSQPRAKEDKIGMLITGIYKTLQKYRAI